MIFVEIHEDYITVKNLFFTVEKSDFSYFKGYKTRIHTTRVGNFEELVIFNDAKKIIISELFLKNYCDLKKLIGGKLSYHGRAQKPIL
mgnify:CR=1 FL=1